MLYGFSSVSSGRFIRSGGRLWDCGSYISRTVGHGPRLGLPARKYLLTECSDRRSSDTVAGVFLEIVAIMLLGVFTPSGASSYYSRGWFWSLEEGITFWIQFTQVRFLFSITISQSRFEYSARIDIHPPVNTRWLAMVKPF